MITNIEFADVAQSDKFSYAAKLEFFKNNSSISFKPGLNILYGPNGCGKSTILRMLALTLAAEQGGVSTITNTWVDDVAGFCEDKMKGISVSHDGQPILYGNPRSTVGLIGGGAAFDDDFMMEGLRNIQSKASTGFITIGRLERMLGVLHGEVPFPGKIENRLSKTKSDKITMAMKLLEPSVEAQQKTLLFDEPESGLALPVQDRIFNNLVSGAKKNDLQIIIATHSVFSLHLPGVNYIEMKENYIQHSIDALQMLELRKTAMEILKKRV